MKQVETTNQSNGFVSAPGAQPKNNQTPFTEQEKQLAAKYKVEPKLVRLLNEIVGHQRSEKLSKGQKEPTQESEQPSTGIPQLDRLIEESILQSQAMAYTCLEIQRIEPKIGQRIKAALQYWVNLCRRGELLKEYDVECDILPALKWINFAEGFQVAGDRMDKVNPADQPNTYERHCTEDKAGPGLKNVVSWMLKRSHTEKVAAVLLWELISKEFKLANEGLYKDRTGVGNDLMKDWQHDITITSQDPNFLRQLNPDEIAIINYTAALITLSV